MRMTTVALGVLAAAVFVAGCGGKDTEQAGADGGAAANGEPSANGRSADADGAKQWHGELKLDIASWPEIQQKIAEQKGKVVVVDFWALFCAPCKEEFPNLVALQKEHGEELAAMSVSLDYDEFEYNTPEAARENVRKFLEEHDARFQNFIASTPNEQLYGDLGIPAIPAIFVYDKSGKLVKKVHADTLPKDKEGNPIDEEVSYEKHVIPLVEKLLAE